MRDVARPGSLPLETAQMAEFSPSRGSVKKVKSEASGSATLGTHRRPSVPGGLDIPGPRMEGRAPPRPFPVQSRGPCGFSGGCQSPAGRCLSGDRPGRVDGGRGHLSKSTEAARRPGTPPQPRPRSPAGAPPPPLRRALPGYREGQSLAKGHRCPCPGPCPPVPRDG